MLTLVALLVVLVVATVWSPPPVDPWWRPYTRGLVTRALVTLTTHHHHRRKVSVTT